MVNHTGGLGYLFECLCRALNHSNFSSLAPSQFFVKVRPFQVKWIPFINRSFFFDFFLIFIKGGPFLSKLATSWFIATCKGVLPSPASAFLLAPLSTSSFTTVLCPQYAAIHSGVSPFSLLDSM